VFRSDRSGLAQVESDRRAIIFSPFPAKKIDPVQRSFGRWPAALHGMQLNFGRVISGIAWNKVGAKPARTLERTDRFPALRLLAVVLSEHMCCVRTEPPGASALLSDASYQARVCVYIHTHWHTRVYPIFFRSNMGLFP